MIDLFIKKMPLPDPRLTELGSSLPALRAQMFQQPVTVEAKEEALQSEVIAKWVEPGYLDSNPTNVTNSLQNGMS